MPSASGSSGIASAVKAKEQLPMCGRKFASLTLREQEVMGFVTAGLMNKQIAGEMQLAEITVKLHRSSVMRKMEAKSLADLVRMADIVGIRKKM